MSYHSTCALVFGNNVSGSATRIHLQYHVAQAEVLCSDSCIKFALNAFDANFYAAFASANFGMIMLILDLGC